MDDALISILAVVFLFGTPVFLGLIGGIVWRMNTLSKYRERERARALYERLVTEKIDVIKTALVMGMSRDELNHLDQRLEQLIGTEKMQMLLDEKAVVTPAATQISAADLDAELESTKPLGGQRDSERR